MRAQCSYSAGICVLFDTIESAPIVVYLDDDVHGPATSLPPWAALISDWNTVYGPAIDAILLVAKQTFWAHRCGSYIEACLSGLSADIVRDTVSEIELILQSRAEARTVVRLLARAPLLHPTALYPIRSAALAMGCGTTASIANDVIEFQPHLRRFADAWFAANQPLAFPANLTPPLVYLRVVEHDLFLAALTDESPSTLSNIFFDIAVDDPDTANRQIYFAICRNLTSTLYRHAAPVDFDREEGTEATENTEETAPVDRPSHTAFLSSLRQVEAIVESVAQGNDTRAEIFLQDLIKRQTASPSGIPYALKSLCNIATRCADLFRVDFERFCLDSAIELCSSDSWAWTQMADHLKRTGDYTGALSAADRAFAAGGGVIAQSSRADILAQMGDLEGALQAYRSIDGYETLTEVRTAIADLIRRSGDLSTAEQEYRNLTLEGMHSDRVDAGMAEIAKRRGDFASALNYYEAVLKSAGIPARAKCVYRSALAGIFKLQGRYLEALDVVQTLIAEYPFFMRAKVVRGSILGLLDREFDGLIDIPRQDRPRAFGEWWRNYTRGLLLLRMREFAQARIQLVDNYDATTLSSDEMEVGQLAAALFFIMIGQTESAARILSPSVHMPDEYVTYVRSVLRLHIAMLQKDEASVDATLSIIATHSVSDPVLIRVVELITRGDLRTAEIVEVDLLLRLAA